MQRWQVFDPFWLGVSEESEPREIVRARLEERIQQWKQQHREVLDASGVIPDVIELAGRYVRQGELALAWEWLIETRRGCSWDLPHPELLMALGDLAAELGRPEIILDLEKVAESMRDWRLIGRQAQIYDRQNRPEAAACYARALDGALEQDEVQAHRLCARILELDPTNRAARTALRKLALRSALPRSLSE